MHVNKMNEIILNLKFEWIKKIVIIGDVKIPILVHVHLYFEIQFIIHVSWELFKKKKSLMTYLPFLWRGPSWPEEMWACADAATLVWFLEEFGGSQGTLSSERFVVLVSKATHLFERADDERNGCKLGFAITDLIFI